MRLRLPASRQTFRLRSALGDIALAGAAPMLALVLRDAMVLDDSKSLMIFWVIAFLASVASFSIFNLYEQSARHFSARDALNIVKAVVCSDMIVAFSFFTLARLDGVPRSTLVIHLLLLSFGLLIFRLLSGAAQGRIASSSTLDVEPENALLLAFGPVSSHYIDLVEQSSSGRAKIVAVVDDCRKAHGRTIAGVPVTGPLDDLDAIVHEFAVHGEEIGTLLICGSRAGAEAGYGELLSRVSAKHKIEIIELPSFAGLWREVVAPAEPGENLKLKPHLPNYFAQKRRLELLIASVALAALSPILVAVYVLTLVGVGAPAIFWQKRLGRGGRKFSVLKFRTLRAPYDGSGRPVSEAQRLTRVGRFLRRSHLDELLQLVNVLTGDMSLVGPRPLLLADQPQEPSIRLSVPPGMTGWAQINGGVLLSAAEKDQLDEWYIRNASLTLDVRILLLTVKVAIFGQAKMQERVGQALPWHREGQTQI